MSQATIAFLGTGNMARAILEGLLADGYPADKIWATRRQVELLDDLKQLGVHTSADNSAAIAAADAVVLSVKPQMMQTTVEALQADLQRHKPLLISVAAGISVAALEHWGGGELAIIRAMPNTPSLLKCGACGLFGNERTTDAERQLAEQMMDAVGISLWVNQESDIDKVTAVSGSGPAYYFLMMEKMIEAGIELGLDRETATRLTLQTALGAAKMATGTDLEPAELRRRVTSPGGTTEQAILSFERDQLGETVTRAMTACANRAAELTELLCKKC